MVATLFCITGVALWIAVGVVVSNPPHGGKLKSCYGSVVLHYHECMIEYLASFLGCRAKVK